MAYPYISSTLISNSSGLVLDAQIAHRIRTEITQIALEVIDMPQWRTRKRGSSAQIGKHFVVTEKGSKSKLPTALRLVSYSKTGKPIYEKVPVEESSRDEKSNDIVEEAAEELREEESIKKKLAREIGDFKAEIEKSQRRKRLKEALKEIERRDREGVYYEPEEESEE